MTAPKPVLILSSVRTRGHGQLYFAVQPSRTYADTEQRFSAAVRFRLSDLASHETTSVPHLAAPEIEVRCTVHRTRAPQGTYIRAFSIEYEALRESNL